MFTKIPRLFSIAAALAVSFGGGLRADVVINEINFRPGTTFPENPKGEFIELRNTGAAAVSLTGWQFTKGVTFTFATGASIQPNGYLVVASDLATFNTQHPGVTNVVGSWAGSLGNTGEDITLVNELGVTQDSVSYHSEGDWAQRVREATFGGWDWSSLANGGGRTLELRNAAIDNDNGQNWQVSAVAGGTPGAANAAVSANIEPMISGVQHSPASPRSTDPVTISCKVVDETPAAGLTATLFWRNATTTTPGAFTPLAMTGDGTGKFSATIAAQANLAIIEFYVQASDGTLTRTWPAPTSEGQNANCLYQVTNEAFTTTDANYLLVLTGTENAAYTALAAANPNSDRQFNITLVSFTGTDTTVRYRSSMRIRGNSSRNYQFKPLRITMPNDDLWNGASVFNLNPKASFLQYFGNRLFNAAGVRSSESVPVELRRNGAESTTSTGSTPDYGKWARIEDEGGDLVGNHWPVAKTGNLYKKIDNGGGLNFYWRTGQAAPATPDLLLDGWSKQNNSSVNDWTDLTAFFQIWQAAARPHFTNNSATDVSGSNATRISGAGTWNNTAFTAAEITSVETVADLDQWARWFAVMTIMQDLETKISNGVDDDYAAYFIPVTGGLRKMQLVAHDLDTIFGLGDDPQAANYTGLYDMTEVGQAGYTFRSLLPLFGTTAVAGNAAFRTKYFTAIRELYGSVLNASTAASANPPFYQFVDSHLTGWVPPAQITSMKNFATARQTYLLGLIGSAAIAPTAPTSTTTLAGPHGNLFISEVLARNVAALQNGAAFPDFIELRNSGATAVSLAGMSLTDDPLLPTKYVFPAGTTIAAGAHLVVFADADAAAPGLHTGFSLDQDGDTVRLHDTAANAGALLDSVTFGPQATDRSISRTGAALDVWALTLPTPNAANGTPVALGNLAAVRINELASNPDYLFNNDFIELYNPDAQPVALGGVAVTDDFINYPTRHVLPPLSFMDAADFLVLRPKGSSASPGNSTELAFKFDTYSANLTIIGANATVIDTADIPTMPRDFSRGRSPNGGVTFAYFGLPTNIPTPGSANVAPPANVLALLNNLRVTEIHYTPTPLEFIELRNIGATALDLSGVRFTKGIEYIFAAGTTLAPNAYIVVCADRAAFTAQYGAVAALAPGVFTGTLDNADDSLSLQPPVPSDVNILSFTYSGSWFPETDLGYSLAAATPAVTLARNWGDKDTWIPSSQIAGTPGAGEPPGITSALAVSAQQDAAFNYQIVATQSPTGYSASGLPSGLVVNTATGLISGTPTQSGTSNVTIGATNANGADSKTLVLSVSVFGPLTGFEWAAIGAQIAGTPFTATLRARDAAGRTVATYNGLAQISASNGTGTITSTPSGFVNLVNGVWTAQIAVLATSNTAELQAVITGQPLTRSNAFVVSVINTAPSFTKGADQTAAEDAGARSIPGWAANISPGLAAESGQTVAFTVSADNPALFAAPPAITPTGTLSFTSAPNVNGSATITVTLKDNGGTANGGIDTSTAQTFTITVLPANDAPTIVAGPDVSVLQTAGAQSIAWATGIGAGALDEAAQTLGIQTVAATPSLFTVQPAVAADGTLTFTPAPDSAGTSNVTVTVTDNGGTANGGKDTTQRIFKITTRGINHAPVFTAGGNVSAGIKAAVTQGWASLISPGAASESAQSLTFLLTNDSPLLFTAPPAISPAGVLTFTPGKKAGLATIKVRLKDNGGTDDGGVDTSGEITFTIRITKAAQAAGQYRGLAGPAATAAPEFARLGRWEMTLISTGAFTGKVFLGGKKFAVIGAINHAGVAGFTQNGTPPLSFHVDFSGAQPRLVGEILNGGAEFVALTAERDAYSETATVPASLRTSANKGKYTTVFAALAAPNGGLDAAHYPQADGSALLKVSKIGVVTLSGQFADGTPFLYTSALDAQNAFPFYAPLYKKRGAVGGPIRFNTSAGTLLESPGLLWYRPAGIDTAFPDGWSGGIGLGLHGSVLSR